MTGAIVEPTKVEVREICFDGIMGEKDQKLVTNLSRVTRWRLEREGKFPTQVQLSPGRRGRRGPEIRDWIESRPRVGKGRS